MLVPFFSGSAAAGASSNTSASANVSTNIGHSSSSNVSASKNTSSSKVNGDTAGLALSSAGGIQSALETAKINETTAVSGGHTISVRFVICQLNSINK